MPCLGYDASVANHRSEGGTAPERVQEAVAAARRRFLDQPCPE